MQIQLLHLNNFLDYARVRGISREALLKEIKNPPVNSDEETAVIDQEDFYAVLASMDKQLEDELWGIKAANFLALKLLGLIYQISLQAVTIQEALHYLQSYLQVSLPIFNMQTSAKEEWITLILEIKNGPESINRKLLENAMTVISREIRMMSADEPNIGLTSPFWTVDYPDDWEKGEVFSISFQPLILKAAMRNNAHLQLEILIPGYIRLIEQLKTRDTFTDKVKMTMLSMSDPNLPDIEEVSNALYLTPRTLQRKLESEQTSFRELLEGLKKQISTLLLRHELYSVSTISYVLGYSEPAAFIHSFKKWFGDSPEVVRRNLINEV